jgi:hypothetical protein
VSAEKWWPGTSHWFTRGAKWPRKLTAEQITRLATAAFISDEEHARVVAEIDAELGYVPPKAPTP